MAVCGGRRQEDNPTLQAGDRMAESFKTDGYHGSSGQFQELDRRLPVEVRNRKLTSKALKRRIPYKKVPKSGIIVRDLFMQRNSDFLYDKILYKCSEHQTLKQKEDY